MFNNPYFYPRYMPNMYIPNTISRGTTGGLFSRLGGIFGNLRNINWTNVINNTSRTLGIINQTIPIVKQAGPMIRNAKSILKLASVFKDETDPINNINNDKKKNIVNTTSTNNIPNLEYKNDYSYSNSPTFFVN